ncbi:MAG TPA: 2-succinyl-5-enolpyruvyl-6-hydroxy-3-cyclohexene-1-carboxylic-acid synthase, partial [Planctomycetes bacterium]|nr:2-succinyl-5-enolpyruvyl-6-hydroxy-3-cyclohexene-1-carboxylic-acid synthase [Planctomycetota bacterium]
GFTVHRFFEERSAAFFALGRIRATRRPAAVVTTSGTAAAELLPAAVEAYYEGRPLLLVTADRPARFRGTGAPQCIEQPGLFGIYAPTIADDEGEAPPTLEGWDRRGPAHLNLRFDEPLLPGEIPSLQIQPASLSLPAPPEADPGEVEEALAGLKRPLVILGALEEEDRPAVRDFLLALGAPVYAEAESGLREDPALEHLLLRGGEAFAPQVKRDGVLRVGSVPTLRAWRDLEKRDPGEPVVSLSPLPFPGLSRSTLFQCAPGKTLSRIRPRRTDPAFTAETVERDRAAAERLESLLSAHPFSEPALVRRLSLLAPEGARVYLGNSLPIREWNLAAARENRGLSVLSSRGANGIDGQVSTFLGLARPDRENWALLGDLTVLYDLAAPWILRELSGIRTRIVVMNNRGGRIFGRILKSPFFQDEHEIGFSDWAGMWGLAYYPWDGGPWAPPAGENLLVEVLPDLEASARFWQAHDEVFGKRET